MSIQLVYSKWEKTNVLLHSPALREYIPLTKLFSKENLQLMLEEYGMVYVKPVNGTFGKGVMRVEQLKPAAKGYKYQLNTTIRTFPTLELLHQSLVKKIKSRRYLVQRGIHLLRHNNRRFDIRVMVQRNENNHWEATGIIGRLAHPGKVVTNYHNGGTPMSFERLMSNHQSPTQKMIYAMRLKQISLDIAKELEKHYPGIKELGIDIAVDQQQRPWILEVNTKPDAFIFRKLEDKTMFRKIYKYAVSYGRYKKK
ncbi:YheC/YheD family protein [Paenibacillus sp. ATY16]|uniref:YheC/YheD family protein n=1 Tax=Paenibacillus sp. ATY16 TaxID=1759312 RepID=UPI000E2F0F88|nr:YheC/YheD family protein [Paenibacillus sp. ATY16]MCK9857533.1 YheC/YheD family protein [Paenibacillus sp. ATY16]